MSKNYEYDFDDLLRSYSSLGVKPGGMVYVGADMISLMRYAEPSRDATLRAHLDAIRKLFGPEGTIFVPTASTQLCNTDTVYDPVETPSSDMGVFAEFVRTTQGAVRSMHPFWSVAGIGPMAAELLGSVSRHAYGFGSIWQKFVEHDVMSLNIGKHPLHSVTVIHYIETVIGVPYRYTKEFMHPVLRDGRVSVEPFYMSVLYNDCDIHRDRNRRIFAHFEAHGTMNKASIGRRGHAWSFSIAEFFRVTTGLMLTNIYAWLETPPTRRPYRS